MRHELDHVDSRGLRQDEWAATPPPPGGEPTTAAAVATASATAARHRRMTRAMVGRKGVGGRGESVSGTKEMAREGGEEGQGEAGGEEELVQGETRCAAPQCRLAAVDGDKVKKGRKDVRGARSRTSPPQVW